MPTLYDVTTEQIQHLRELPTRIHQLQTLRGLVDRTSLSDLSLFINEIILGGEKLETWRQDYLVVSVLQAPQVLEMSVQQICEMLRVDGTFTWCQLTVNRERWERMTLFTGAPAVLVRGVGYSWRPPSSHVTTVNIQKNYFVELNAHDSVPIVVRRWMGTLIAKAAIEHQLFDITESSDSLLCTLFPNVVASHDAKLAAHAVLREYQLGTLADHQVLGFVGGDSFYE